MAHAPIVVTGGLLVNDEDQILFGLRALWKAVWPGCWDAIGGHVEPGERVEDALVREVQEEIGVTPTGIHFLEMVENPGSAPGTVSHCHIFAVTSWIGGPPTNACEEHSEIRWFNLGELAVLSNLAGQGYPELAVRALGVRRDEGPQTCRH